ncbi:TPA: fimbrial family protein, partial [Escherichia coli]
ELPGKSSYNLEEMLSAINFTIPYSIASVSDSSNTADIFPGTPFPLLFEIEVSSCTGNNTNCNSVRFNYNLNTILQVNLMTCGFEDQSIDTGRFVLSRINNENYQFHHIRFDCIQGEQGELVFEPSDVEYYFEPVTIQESGTSILKNELENSEDGAGQIGFQLSNDGTNEIQYGKSNYYSFQHPHEGSNQIPLFIRPRTYGNNVSSGQIMSRVKIVVMYN